MSRENKRKQGIRFQAKMLQLVRKYSWNRGKCSQLYRSLRLRPSHIVIDVGCGTGEFSRVIAQGLDYRRGGRLIGIDRNNELLSAARRVTANSGGGFSKVISYRRGDASRSIPLPDSYADRVVCQAFLWLFDDQHREKVIKEMIRVCKPNGIIAASEGAVDSSIVYVEGDDRLSELWKEYNCALIRGYEKIYGYDRSIGYKLPSAFKRLGLKRIRLDVFAWSTEGLLCDDRIPLQHKMDVLRHWKLDYPAKFLRRIEKAETEGEREVVVEKMEPNAVAGGMNHEEIIEFMRLRKVRAERLLANPKFLGEDTSVTVGSAFLTTGIKPSAKKESN